MNNPADTLPSVLVAQLGGRRAYQVPRAFHSRNQLAELYTDCCSTSSLGKLCKAIPRFLRPAAAQKLLDRSPHEIPNMLIKNNSRLAISYYRKLQAAKTPADLLRTYLAINNQFDSWVAASRWQPADAIYLVDSVGKQTVERAKSEGRFVINELIIAPRPIESRLFQQEAEKHPGWENTPTIPPDLQQEWFKAEADMLASCDLLVCGSEFVQNGLAQLEYPVSKSVVVPYGTATIHKPIVRRSHRDPIRVLTIGAVGLRKGTPYIVEAAKRLKGKAVFRVVGPTHTLTSSALELLKQNVELTGQLPRNEVIRQLEWADIYLLPSACEGSASSVYEAMSAALPVIVTNSSGTVITDGIEGFIIPSGDTQPIVEKVQILIEDPKLREKMAAAAYTTSRQFTEEKYYQRLLTAVASAYTSNGVMAGTQSDTGCRP